MPRRKSKAVKKSRRPKVSRRGNLRKKKNLTKLSYRKRVAFSVPRLEGGNNKIEEMLGEMLWEKSEQICRILTITNDKLKDNEEHYKQLIEEYFTEENLVTFLNDIKDEKIIGDTKFDNLQNKIYDPTNIYDGELYKFIQKQFTDKDKARYLKFLSDLWTEIHRRKNKAERTNLLENEEEKISQIEARGFDPNFEINRRK
jgi:hypothetical protein